VELYSSPKEPKGKESNWFQTSPGEGFFVMFRFCGPEREFYDKSWKLDDLQELR
jgi:hypothetical protein